MTALIIAENSAKWLAPWLRFNKGNVLLITMFMLTAQLLALNTTSGQSFSEWFKQKKTQKKYSIQQIAGLEAYLKLVEAGYNVASDGLWLVSALKEGDFMAHVLHFQSLEMVSPAIKHYSKVMAAASLLDQLEGALNKFATAAAAAANSGLISDTETGQVLEYKNRRSLDIEADLSRLEMLVTDQTLTMTDDERMEGIDRLYTELRLKTGRQSSVLAALSALIKLRRSKKKDNQLLLELYGK